MCVHVDGEGETCRRHESVRGGGLGLISRIIIISIRTPVGSVVISL